MINAKFFCMQQNCNWFPAVEYNILSRQYESFKKFVTLFKARDNDTKITRITLIFMPSSLNKFYALFQTFVLNDLSHGQNALAHQHFPSLRENCPNSELFSASYFPAFGLNTEIYSKSPYSVRIYENTKKKQLCIWTLFKQCLQLFINLEI